MKPMPTRSSLAETISFNWNFRDKFVAAWLMLNSIFLHVRVPWNPHRIEFSETTPGGKCYTTPGRGAEPRPYNRPRSTVFPPVKPILSQARNWPTVCPPVLTSQKRADSSIWLRNVNYYKNIPSLFLLRSPWIFNLQGWIKRVQLSFKLGYKPLWIKLWYLHTGLPSTRYSFQTVFIIADWNFDCFILEMQLL